jgi:hypothetical protein
LQCCKSLAEERSAGNPHATFCGNWRRATASSDPVGWETERRRMAQATTPILDSTVLVEAGRDVNGGDLRPAAFPDQGRITPEA